MDTHGVVRSAGRLTNCPTMSYHERYPIILPPKCAFTRLYVQFVHVASLHGEIQVMSRLIRMEFWIPRVKNTIRAVVHRCKPCILYKKQLLSQLMGALPVERTTISRPFVNTGLDFAGPFDVRSSKLRNAPLYKCYVCVFVCFATKAVHLEGTTDLTTSAFKAAFQRFISRRGCPQNLYSDNGTTFVGADKAIAKDFFEACRFGALPADSFQQPKWHFIPPSAPHMGGLWEAAVKSFKRHFRKVAGPFKYTYEEFSTLLSRIEAVLNSRPIAPLNEDPTDLNALTPGHFLTGGPILAPPEDEENTEPVSIVERWRRLRAVYQEICCRWKHEYLKAQLKRPKWQQECDNLKAGDMVIITEDHLLPLEWRLGRVTQPHPGKDQLTRVVEIRTAKNIVTRPIAKLILLPSPTNSQID